MRRTLLLAAVLLAGCASPVAAPDAYTRPPDASTSAEVAIAEDQVGGPPPFGAKVPVHVRVTVRVVSGAAIDAWLAGTDACQEFGRHAFAPADRLLNATHGTLEADFPAGTQCLLLDNTPFAMGQARPQGDVVVNFTIDIWER